MTPEHRLSNQIRIWCGEHNFLCFHINVGKIRMSDGTYFHTGVPVGWPDLTIITDNGQVVFIETKIKPRQPTQQQIDMLNELKNRGFIAEVVYDFQSFLRIFEKVL